MADIWGPDGEEIKTERQGGKLQNLQGIELIDKDDVVFVIAVHLAVSSLESRDGCCSVRSTKEG